MSRLFDLAPRSDYFSEAHHDFRRSVRQFVEREIAPHVNDWDEAGTTLVHYGLVLWPAAWLAHAAFLRMVIRTSANASGAPQSHRASRSSSSASGAVADSDAAYWTNAPVRRSNAGACRRW